MFHKSKLNSDQGENKQYRLAYTTEKAEQKTSCRYFIYWSSVISAQFPLPVYVDLKISSRTQLVAQADGSVNVGMAHPKSQSFVIVTNGGGSLYLSLT